MITPSDEFRAGGPLKQDLTSHVGPTVLSVSLLLLKIEMNLFFVWIMMFELNNSKNYED